MKFVIRSRILFAKLNDDKDQDRFEASLEGTLNATNYFDIGTRSHHKIKT